MNSVVERLEHLDETLAAMTRDVFENETIPDLPGEEIAGLLVVTAQLQRRLESLQIEAAGQVRERSECVRDERLSTQYGCARPVDMVRMLTLVDSRVAGRLMKASRIAQRERGITDGAFLPARYPELRQAMLDGDLGLDGFLAAAEPLESASVRIGREDLAEADRQLGALASGIRTQRDATGADHDVLGPLPAPDELKVLSQAFVTYLDPDGAEPSDEVASRGRYLRLGAVRNGLAPLRGELLPDVAAQLQLLIDSILNPRADGPDDLGVHFEPSDECEDPDHPHPDAVDYRTRTQKVHDALATILSVAARSGEMPDLGGAPPTLVVAVKAEDFAEGRGWGALMNTGDLVPMRVAVQSGCAGGIQRVLFDENGRIVALGTSARIFNALQRRAIALRDGGCVIPGCTVSASWCEVHHVREYADGGPTHTDNGVLLCWHHHRTLHLSLWEVRMNSGMPEIRGPAWWDHEHRWRPARNPHLAPVGGAPPGH